jgi:cullin 3
MSRDVRAGDVFSVNDAFTSKLYKVKIGMVTAQVQYAGEGGTVQYSCQRGKGPSGAAAFVPFPLPMLGV